MPYTSKAERERASWMTLREAVEHVRLIEKGTVKDALRQIIAAVNDNEIAAVYEDSKGQPLPSAPVLASPYGGSPPRGRPVYRKPVLGLDEQRMRPRSFEILAIDEAALAIGTLPKANSSFVVLLLRKDVFQIWDGKPKVVPGPGQEDARSKGGRPSRRQDIENILRDENLDRTAKELIALVQGKLGTGRGLSDDVILRVIADMRGHPS